MKPEVLISSRAGGGGGGGGGDGTTALLAQSVPKSPVLSLSIKGKMEGHGDHMGQVGQPFDNNSLMRDEEYDSRSASDNLDGASGDEQNAAEDQRPTKKKYHRHTPFQIQELESFFKECPHPDEKQRADLSRRLGLESKQIKFWFQNRRTQLKTQLERHENLMLRQENDRLRAENDFLKQAIIDPMCNKCGGQVVPGPVSYEQQQLRIENARMKDELSRVTALANKFLGRPPSSSANPIPPPFSSSSNLDLAVGRNGLGGSGDVNSTFPPMAFDYGDSFMTTLMKPMTGALGNEVSYDRSMIIDLAVAAMDELVKKAQVDSPLWIKTSNGREALNHEEYMRTFNPCIGMKPSSFVTEATREIGIAIISSMTLVDILMDTDRFMEMFSTMVARASTIDVIASGVGGTKNGALQVMLAEFQVLSPLVPVRQVKFLRFCKQHSENVWAVVDVSIDSNQVVSNVHPLETCRRLPSGCIIQEMPNGCCKVTWVEHAEYDESSVHQLYRPALSSGRGFGAQRWVATLQRYCKCLAILMSHPIPNEDHAVLSLSAKKSILKVAQRMVNNFCLGICCSSIGKWEKVQVTNVGEDVRVFTRKSINDPGEPAGLLLCAATSVWVPVTRQRLLDFFTDERTRSDWDILSHGGLMQEMVHIGKGQGRDNCISLLRSSAGDGSTSESSMIVLQEVWNDLSGSLIVYAPVDISSMSMVMNGGDSTYVALLPSGFVITPDDSFDHGVSNICNGTLAKRDGEDVCDGGGSLLTVGFQILVDNLPTTKLTMESVDTVSHLISCTIQRIRAAFQLVG